MPTKPVPNATPNLAFTRLQHPDPQTNFIVQDLYDKLAQVLQQLAVLTKAPS